MGLIQEFQKTDEERRREVKQLQSEVASMLKNFATRDKERQAEVAAIAQEATAIIEAADTFVKDLAKGSAERASDVANMLTDLKAQAQGRQAEVAAIAQEASAIVEAADNFVKDLAKGSIQRRSEVATMLKGFAREDAERRSDVADIHEMVWGKAPTRRKAAPVVKESPRAAAIETAPAAELRDKVFTYLANHPDGTRLTELEEEFGVARIQTARVVRELMDGNKVEKRDLLYFVI